MKRNPFISRLATRVAAVALTIGAAFSFSACSDDDEVDNSGSFKTRLEVPAVAAFSQSDATTSTLKFRWEAVDEATHYMAQIRLSETGDIFQEKQLQGTEVSFVGLNDDTDYYFRVSAQYTYDESRNSAYSEWVVGKTEKADPTRPTLSTPANPMCDKSKTTSSSLTFNWESVENAAGYNVVLTAIGEEDYTASTSETTYTFVGLKKGVKYFFTVQAAEVEGYNASDFTGQVNATTTDQLATPANLECKVKMSEAAQFAWEEVAGAATYAYELTTITAAGETVVMEGLLTELNPDEIVPGKTVSATTTNTTMTFRGLERDTYYAFRVKAVATEGSTAVVDSEYTDYYVIKTLVTDATPLAAPALTVDEAQQLKILVSWAPVAGALGYDYQFATPEQVTAGDEAAYVSGELRETTDEITGEVIPLTAAVTLNKIRVDGMEELQLLTPQTAYRVRVKTIANPANPTDGDSSWSDWMTVSTAALADELTVDASEKLSDAILRMAEGGVLTLLGGEYVSTGTIYFDRSVRIVAAAGQTPVLKLADGNFNITGGSTISTIELKGLKMIGKQKAGGGDHIFNVSAACTVENLKFVDCEAYDFDRSFFRTQNSANIKNILIENTFAQLVTGSTQSYDIVQLDRSPQTCVIRNSTFVNAAAFYRCNNVLAEATTVTVENCTFAATRSGGQLFRITGSTHTVSFKNIVLSGALTKGGNNATSSGFVNAENFFIASDVNFGTGFAVAPVKESLTSAELFPDAAAGNYKPAAGSQAFAAGAGDSRWLK